MLRCEHANSGEVTFVQVYVDSPHTHPTTQYLHPVSGVVTVCDLLHPETTRAMYRRAISYLEHITDMERKLCYNMSCRLELVRLYRAKDMPVLFRPHSQFHLTVLMEKQERRPLLVPFVDSNEGQGLMSTLRLTVSYLVARFKDADREYGGRGCVVLLPGGAGSGGAHPRADPEPQGQAHLRGPGNLAGRGQEPDEDPQLHGPGAVEQRHGGGELSAPGRGTGRMP